MLGPSTELLVSNTNHNLMLTINGIDILTLCFSSGAERVGGNVLIMLTKRFHHLVQHDSNDRR